MNGHVNSAETQKSPHAHRRRESLQLNLSADEPEEVYGLKHPVAHPRIKVADDSTTEGPGQTNLNANVHAPLADSDDEEFDDNVSISSLFADAIEELGDEKLLESDNGPDYCSYEEAVSFRKQLRSIGPKEFCAQTVENGSITAKKLLSAFGIRPPEFLEGCDDESYYNLLSLAISRELSKRMKLPEYNTIDDAVELIRRSRNIIVLTGAGISTSLGIPDFRSKDIGLYEKLKYLGLNDPQEVFDISLFREDPTIFFSVAKDILPDINRYTPTHKFIYMLQERGKLLTNYSQNIDNIESNAGIRPEKLIQCHGSFATATCVECRYQVPGDTIFEDIRNGNIPRCDRCISQQRAALKPAAMKRKRSANSLDKKKKRGSSDEDDDPQYNLPEAGVMKPDITFFGEALPDKFSDRLTGHDKDLVDLVIVMGTSLKVAPVSEVVPYLPADIPQMYISRDPVSHVNFDIDMLGDCDIIIEELCRRLNWGLEHEALHGGEISIELVEGFTSRHKIKAVKNDVKVGEEVELEDNVKTEATAKLEK